jgi:NADH-quinone oxidoreductase subunit N
MDDFLPYISQSLNNTLISIRYFLPELTLTVAFIVVIITDLFFSNKKSTPVFLLTLLGLVLTALLSFNQVNLTVTPVALFGNMIVLDRFAVLFKLIFGIVAVLFVVFVRNNRQIFAHRKGSGDLYTILLAVQLGLHLMAMSSNLIMFFVAIEMVSIGSYLMVGYVAGNSKQTEASMKYALFGSVCSAIMLYGMSLIYAFSGTLDILDPAFITNLMKIPSLGIGVAVTMILVGIGFKLSFVPFHFWSPDVYQGAPTPVTAFLSTGPKVAGFAILVRFLAAFHEQKISGSEFMLFDFNAALTVIAMITMIAGNFSAIWQNNIKRMLAYSSIGHTGFILMALLGLSATGFSSIIFYLLIYAIMNMAAFMLADRIEEQTGAINIDDYKGLGKKLKTELFCFIIILLSLIGLPPTAGFIGKFLVFSSALEYYTLSGSPLVIILLATGAIATVVSLFYYFKVPLNAYLRESERVIVNTKRFPFYLILVLTLLVLILGVFPSTVTTFINDILQG